MKNLRKWFPLTLAFIFVFTLSSCNEECPCEDESKPIAPPKQIVSVEDAKLMYDTYSARRKPLIQRYEDSINRRGDEDQYDKMKQQKMQQNDKDNSESREAAAVDSFPVARYVHYDYQTIKDYLTFIEQEAKDKGIEISTLRFYFSNYPEDMSVENAKPRQNSVFVMPTITQDNRTFGYFLNEKEELKLLTDDLKVSKTPFKPKSEGTKVKASFLPEFESSLTTPNLNFYQGQSYILNRGGSAPPPYPAQ